MPINNSFYDTLGEDWLQAQAHPVALLRAENALRNPWIASHLLSPSCVLDLGCGAGLLTNFLASQGHTVYGIDLSAQSLSVAAKTDSTHTVSYQRADVKELPFPDAHFDVVCAMDLLEHVEEPEKVVQEASRVLKKGGLFFFHTFNRNFWSYLIVIKGVEWFVKNTPPHMHVYPLFIKPQELKGWCTEHSLQVEEIKGVIPKFTAKQAWKVLRTGVVPEDLVFGFTSSLKTGYSGCARKI